MAGFVGQDALGGGQGHRVFVDDGVVGAGFAVFGDIEQWVDSLGGDHQPHPTAQHRQQGTDFNRGCGWLFEGG
ncbi:hypothetical protein D3C79_1108570 [compost metagenome]